MKVAVSHPVHNLLQMSTQFESALREQAQFAAMNLAALDLCLSLDQSHPEEGRLTPEAIGMAYASVARLMPYLLVEALDLETAAAHRLEV